MWSSPTITTYKIYKLNHNTYTHKIKTYSSSMSAFSRNDYWVPCHFVAFTRFWAARSRKTKVFEVGKYSRCVGRYASTHKRWRRYSSPASFQWTPAENPLWMRRWKNAAYKPSYVWQHANDQHNPEGPTQQRQVASKTKAEQKACACCASTGGGNLSRFV